MKRRLLSLGLAACLTLSSPRLLWLTVTPLDTGQRI